jgi:hypothetical protein
MSTLPPRTMRVRSCTTHPFLVLRPPPCLSPSPPLSHNHNNHCPCNRLRRSPQIKSTTSAALTTSLPKPEPTKGSQGQGQAAIPLLLRSRDSGQLERPVRVQFSVHIVRHRSNCGYLDVVGAFGRRRDDDDSTALFRAIGLEIFISGVPEGRQLRHCVRSGRKRARRRSY